MSSLSNDADVLVVGAGPAGVAAALMAASLKYRTVVVEADRIGGKLPAIGALGNAPGSWSTGPQLVEALALDLKRLEMSGWCTVEHGRAVAVSAYDDRAELALEDGQVLRAQVIVVATGVTSLTPDDVSWIDAPTDIAAPPLWRAVPADLANRTYVLGGDRPLGTWLRAHPDVATTLHVLHPLSDDYKVAEVEGDNRVRLMPVAHVSLAGPATGGGWAVEVTDRRGQRERHIAATVLSNLGNRPAALKGLLEGEDGYCPSEQQHPRIRVAGDLRSARYQRIVTAQGSGAEAVLAWYYAAELRQR
ncbi:FAD-dependent oxidoreductase [Streptomyces capparidis]